VTVATAVFDDCQLAWDVTVCVEPFDSVAVATNCVLAPMPGATPVTDTDATVGAGVVGVVEVEGDDEPHADAIVAAVIAAADAERDAIESR
jgi:hypothetical protein